jgi:uncharacterized membrane protein
MLDDSTRLALVPRRAIHSALVICFNLCFVGTLLTDIAYWQTAEMMWANFSAWLLTAGLVIGVLAILAFLIEIISSRVVRSRPGVWLRMVGSLVVLVVSFFNALIHTRDAWTSVVPTGLMLSVAAVIVMAVTGLLGRARDRGRE